MTAKQLLDYVKQCDAKNMVPYIPNLSVQVYHQEIPFRFCISLANDPNTFSVTFMLLNPQYKALQIDIYYAERGENSTRPDWKRPGTSSDWGFDEDVTVLPKRFPGWNLEELVSHLEAFHPEEELS